MVGPVAMISLLLHEGLEGSMVAWLDGVASERPTIVIDLRTEHETRLSACSEDQYQCPLWHNQTHSEVERQRHVPSPASSSA